MKTYWKVVSESKEKGVYLSCRVRYWIEYWPDKEATLFEKYYLRTYSTRHETKDGLVFKRKKDALKFMDKYGLGKYKDILFKCKVNKAKKVKKLPRQSIAELLEWAVSSEGKTFSEEKLQDAPEGTYHAEGIQLIGEPVNVGITLKEV